MAPAKAAIIRDNETAVSICRGMKVQGSCRFSWGNERHSVGWVGFG